MLFFMIGCAKAVTGLVLNLIICMYVNSTTIHWIISILRWFQRKKNLNILKSISLQISQIGLSAAIHSPWPVCPRCLPSTQFPVAAQMLSKQVHVISNDAIWESKQYFLAVTKQLYEWFSTSVCPSVCPSHLFDYVSIIVSSWNFYYQLLPVTEVTSMQKVKVRGQRSRSQRSQPNFTVSGL